MTSRIPQAFILLALFVCVDRIRCRHPHGDAHLKYPNNPFFNHVYDNVWESQNQNIQTQQQLQTMLTNSQMALNNQLAANLNNLLNFYPMNQGAGSRPYPMHLQHNPFLNSDYDGYIIPNGVTKPAHIYPVENTTPMPIPIRPPYINPVDTSGTTPGEGIEGTTPGEGIEPTSTEGSMFEMVDGIPVIPLTENEIRR